MAALTPWERQQFKNATARLRYAAVPSLHNREFTTTEDVVAWLERYAVVLADGLDTTRTETERLLRVERDVMAMRRVLNTDPKGN
jgi:hypothetical protein